MSEYHLTTEPIPITWNNFAREHYKNAYFMWLYNLTPLGLWPNFFDTFLTPGWERCVMIQLLTTGPPFVIFLRIDQFNVVCSFFFCRVWINLKHFFVIILNRDQWIRCCVKSSIFSSGDHNVQESRTGWVVLVEGLTRNVITNCMKWFPIWTSTT